MKWLFTLTASWIFIGAQAQLRFNSLQEIKQYAARNTVIARQTQILVDAAGEETGIQRSGLLPKVNLYGTADYYPVIATQLIPESVFGGQDGKFREVRFGLPFGFVAGVEVSMPIINLEKWKQLDRAKLQQVQTGWTQKTQLESLYIQLTQLYYQELAMKAAVKLNLQNQEYTTRLMKVMDERKQNGILNPSDYNRSKNLHLDVLNTGKEYDRTLQQARNALHASLNLPDSVSMVILDSLPEFNWPLLDIAVNDITRRPGWSEAQARVDVSRASWEESKKAALPRLSFYGRYAYNWQMQFDNNVNIGFDVSSVGLRFDFPVFQGSYYRHLQKKNDLLMQSSMLDKEKMRSSLQQQQQDWWNNYSNASLQHSILQEKMKVANDNLRIAALNMREGVMEFNEFNEIFMEYNRAQLDYLQNLFDGILYYLLLTQNATQQ